MKIYKHISGKHVPEHIILGLPRPESCPALSYYAYICNIRQYTESGIHIMNRCDNFYRLNNIKKNRIYRTAPTTQWEAVFAVFPPQCDRGYIVEVDYLTEPKCPEFCVQEGV